MSDADKMLADYTGKHADAESFYGMALWYAFGRLDSKEYDLEKSKTLDAFEFASAVKVRRIDFLNEKTHFFESIQGQWEAYVESKA